MTRVSDAERQHRFDKHHARVTIPTSARFRCRYHTHLEVGVSGGYLGNCFNHLIVWLIHDLSPVSFYSPCLNKRSCRVDAYNQEKSKPRFRGKTSSQVISMNAVIREETCMNCHSN